MLGAFKQRGGKTVLAFALAGDFDPAMVVSNMIELQWPPRSGGTITVPEIDRAAWFDIDTVREKILIGQRPILDEFAARVPRP
jgi:predicted NUDIX family NTP pyrophosphohydrolase